MISAVHSQSSDAVDAVDAVTVVSVVGGSVVGDSVVLSGSTILRQLLKVHNFEYRFNNRSAFGIGYSGTQNLSAR